MAERNLLQHSHERNADWAWLLGVAKVACISLILISLGMLAKITLSLPDLPTASPESRLTAVGMLWLASLMLSRSVRQLYEITIRVHRLKTLEHDEARRQELLDDFVAQHPPADLESLDVMISISERLDTSSVKLSFEHNQDSSIAEDATLLEKVMQLLGRGIK